MQRSDLEGYFKVERAADPEWRAKILGSGHLFKMIVHKVYRDLGHLEGHLHKAVENNRAMSQGTGHEWYCMPLDELLSQADAVISINKDPQEWPCSKTVGNHCPLNHPPPSSTALPPFAL